MHEPDVTVDRSLIDHVPSSGTGWARMIADAREQGQGFQWVTMNVAADLLETSTSSIRRHLTAGTLEFAKQARPQGFRYLVRLPANLTPPTAKSVQAPVDEALTYEEQSDETQQNQSPWDDFAAQIAKVCSEVVDPLLGELHGRLIRIERHLIRQSEEREVLAGELIALKIQLNRSDRFPQRPPQGSSTQAEARERLLAELTPPGNA